MALFSVGSTVILADTNARGVVVEVKPARRSRQIYRVSFSDGIIDVLEPDLRADFDEDDPFDCSKSGLFGSYADFSKINTTFKIQNSNNSTISSLKASKTLFRAYQFKPLLKFLNSPTRRILVADEVGLGKTIEAGHVMLELKARKELGNVLIVCPKSLQHKWKAELLEKFGLDFKIYQTTQDLIDDLSSGAKTVRAIVNYERIRLKENKDDDKEAKQRKKPVNLIDYMIENPCRFSMVLCDEAHKLRNNNTQTYKGAEIIMGNTDSALFLTATPVMIDEENLYNLLHLLDSKRYFNYQIFRNRIEENKPFIEALSMLNSNQPLTDIRDKLLSTSIKSRFVNSDEEEIYSSSSSISDIYKDDPLFQEIIELLGENDTPTLRARLQYLISSMSVMNTVFSRTRKREVTMDMSQAERQPHVAKVDLYDDERKEFDNVIEEYKDDNSYVDYWGEEKMTQGGALGLVQKKRQVASSVWAYLNDEADLDKGIDKYANYKDAKIDKILEIIKHVFKSKTKKLVIFALFRKTLKYLAIRLKKAGFNSVIIHGQVSSEDRNKILHQFKTDDNTQILLSSEVGSEGLDMQFCNSMVNYDLPWNPMVVEQRIGRIDRFGQKAKVVNIYNIIVSDSIQEMIYMRLLDRIGIFKGTVGDMEAILDAPIGEGRTIQDVYNKMEKEFFTENLSPEAQERKIAEVERAIENEKEHLKHLKEGLSNALTNDAYFRDEINKILYNHAYVTGVELKNYLESVIRLHLTTCTLEETDTDVFEFRMPMSHPTVLRNFLTQYGDETSDENRINLAAFKRKIDGVQSFRLTFDQAVAYEDSTLVYMNIYHPFIMACLRFLTHEDSRDQRVFSYSIKADEILNEGEIYYLGIYRLKINRQFNAENKESCELLPILYNVNNDFIIENQQLIDRVFKKSQVDGSEKNASNVAMNDDLIENMRGDFTEFVSSERKRRIEESRKQELSDRLRNVQQTKEYYQARIDGLENLVAEYEYRLEWCYDDKEKRRLENILRLRRGNVRQLEKERDERLAELNKEITMTVSENILSLNLVTVV